MKNLVRLLAVPAPLMRSKPVLKLLGASATLVAIALFVGVAQDPRALMRGQESDRDQDQSKVEIGLSIAPVPLNFRGKGS